MFKNSIIYFLLSFFIFISCNKNNEKNTDNSEKFVNQNKIELISLDRSIDLSISTRAACSINDDNFLISRLDSNNSKVIQEIFNNAKFKTFCLNYLTNELHNSIQDNKKYIKTIEMKFYDKNKPDYDIVIVGAGVHSSIFSLNYKLKYPNAKILVVDSANSISEHFKSTDYLINSPENRPMAPSSTNILPNSPIQLADFGNKTDTFFIANNLWKTIVLNSFASGSDILLNTAITDYSYNHKNKIFTVKLDNNATIFTNKIIVSNGLGTPKFEHFSDENFKNSQINLASKCFNSDCLPSVMTFDDLIKFNEHWKSKGSNVYNVLKNKKEIAVVGAGDAANVLIEFLYDAAPPEAYSHVSSNNLYQKINNLYWYAQKHSTSVSFLSDDNIKPRYKTFRSVFYKDLFDNKIKYKMNPYNSHLTKISFDNIKNKVLLTDDSFNTLEFDQVILTSGYTNSVSGIISPILKKQIDEKDLKNNFIDVLNSKNRAIARKLKLENGQPIELYVIGTAAGASPSWHLANDDDLKESVTKNSASINVLAPKSAEFASSL
ncbi:hypothetical protein QEJ31_02420 [Pigmentibacter sp. JX0631]|uniref:hypothetical protein n=1 Tax=Pigmentibacter sp. JX0631 TaxID=2976982 RepID=UPI002468875D|nr:hypothetical protein [Pigmentibacter sp. JX0631]WGL60455.1 hypothetical protein QEJ31_02420 [Pigmentibacter sp. JX0631]